VGKYHHRLTLPDGREAVADYRDPITETMHAILRARAADKAPDPADVAAMTAWLEAHLEQAALCGRGECDHHV
jgi:hypothetical protein